MRGVSIRSRRAVAAWLLIVVLLAPSAYASDATNNASLWDEFISWLQGGLDTWGGATAADESAFTAWLMGRIWIPGG